MEMKQSHRQYTCPMHPEVLQDTPGLCPECGMNLIPLKDADRAQSNDKAPCCQGSSKAKPSGRADHHTESFLKKFWIAFVLAIPIFLYSEMASMLFKIRAPQFFGSSYVLLALGSIVFFYCGNIFLTSAYREIKARLPGMMTLIAIAITTAYLYSFYSIAIGSGHDLLFELSSLIAIMLLGHWLEMRAVSGAQSALKELSTLLPDTAEIVREDNTETIPLAELREGDIILTKPGGKIAADGAVIEGDSSIDESLATGESRPVAKQKGSEVIAGTLNGDGMLKIKVTKIGERTFLAGVMRLVAEAQASKSRLQLLSDRAALYLTVVAVGTGALTIVAWIAAGGGTAFAVERLVAVLVIACPHALGLAVPLVASISTTKAAKNGFLVKRRLALEFARNIDVVLFDKTGTLTLGEYGITNVWLGTAHNEKELLGLAASVDQNSEHVIAKAIVKKAQAIEANIVPAQNFTRIPGNGVAGTIAEKRIYVGGEVLVQAHHAVISKSLQKEITAENIKGKTIIYVLADRELLGAFALADLIREESREAVQKLKNMKIRISMVTGDSEGVASWVAKELGIDEYFASVLPHQKSEKVKLLQARGKKVAMVGDGINDAPALAQADLGVAIGAGTNVAIESAGIILVRNDPRDIVKIVTLSRLTYTKMMQNLFWATGYNIIALPLAAGVLASRGILLQPALAAMFMSASTVIVAVNAMLLKRKTL